MGVAPDRGEACCWHPDHPKSYIPDRDLGSVDAGRLNYALCWHIELLARAEIHYGVDWSVCFQLWSDEEGQE